MRTGLAAIVVLALGLLGPGLARAQDSDVEAAARQRLREARVLYERGEFGEALTRFATVLENRPPRVRTPDDLHEGFLHYAFTLYLAGDEDLAADKLQTALRIDPTYTPSPVTTRPDLRAFYLEQQEAWIGEHGSTPEPLDRVFPSLQENPGGLRRLSRQPVFFPAFGIGLSQLGHREVGGGLAALEIGFGLANLGAIVAKAGLLQVATPEAAQAKVVLGWSTLPTMIVFWTTLAVDFVASVSLRQLYKLHPERRPRLDAALRLGRPPPVVRLAAGGPSIAFW
jgi:tetratricopeptide (TPR) repeat protein